MQEAPVEPPPACAPYLRPRAAAGWEWKGPTLEKRWVRGGVRIHFHKWASREGFHQPLARRLDVENVEEEMEADLERIMELLELHDIRQADLVRDQHWIADTDRVYSRLGVEGLLVDCGTYEAEGFFEAPKNATNASQEFIW